MQFQCSSKIEPEVYIWMHPSFPPRVAVGSAARSVLYLHAARKPVLFSANDSAERCWSGRTGLTANSQGYANKRLTLFHRFCLLLTDHDTNQCVAGRILATSVNNGTDVV